MSNVKREGLRKRVVKYLLIVLILILKDLSRCHQLTAAVQGSVLIQPVTRAGR